MEIWGGIECTVNRVRDTFFDQLGWNGHDRRIEDLDAISALGLRTLRYPVLWERVAPTGLANADWRWTDDRLNRLRALKINPIVTLVHHGSGPLHTHLLDPEFATGLAEFAFAVAKRYPWLTHFTPVNEPLTTARFSALYGFWYPHARSMRDCVDALLNEIRGTQLAMEAIRTVNPLAQLVQTEDIGKVFSTTELAYQAAFENERRWLSLDLLHGRVTPGHELWDFLSDLGLDERRYTAITNHPCPPDVIGVNYYATSDRFLDHDLERYPARFHGGNGRHSYADLEAARVRSEGIAGIGAILHDVAARYGAPIAITETHLGGSRVDQLRWLDETWRAANAARDAGIDLRAMTIWALLGSHNWHSLVTRDDGHYETGVFDVRSGRPRPTALAKAMNSISEGLPPAHPLASDPGWWRRDGRLLYGHAGNGYACSDNPAPLVIAGAGSFAQAVARRAQHHGIHVVRSHVPILLDRGRAGRDPDPWHIVIMLSDIDAQRLRDLQAISEFEWPVTIVSPALIGDESRHLSIQVDLNVLRGDRTLDDDTVDDFLDLIVDGVPGGWTLTNDGMWTESSNPSLTTSAGHQLEQYGANARLDDSSLDWTTRIR